MTEKNDRSERSRTRAADNRVLEETTQMERPSIELEYSPVTGLQVPPNKDGYRFRWIAESVLGKATPRNVQTAIGEHYSRVLIEDLPEDFPVEEDIKEDGYARSGGLILMKVSEEYARARQRYFRRKSQEGLHGANQLQGIASDHQVVQDSSRQLSGAEIANSVNRS